MDEDKRKRLPHLKGFLEILLLLKEDKRTFTELKKAANVSPSTVLKRLRESQEKGLIKQDLSSRGGRRAQIKYHLTKEGESLLTEYESIIDRYIELNTELDKLEKAVRDTEKEIKYLLLHGANPNVSSDEPIINNS